jgi:hypothetical protein
MTDSGLGRDGILNLRRLRTEPDLVAFCLAGAIFPSASVFRRSAALAVGGYSEAYAQSEDFEFHVRLAASQVSYGAIEAPLVAKYSRRASNSSLAPVAVWTSATQAIGSLAEHLPARYAPELADAAVRAGSQLFRLGALTEAREAFRLAGAIGRPTFSQYRSLYRWTARWLGPEAAERLGALYRSGLPRSLRASLASRGL